MKKTVFSLVLAAVIFCAGILPVFAMEEPAPTVVQNDDGTTLIYDDLGGCYTITPAYFIETDPAVVPFSAIAKIKTAAKDVTYRNADDSLQWKYTLKATFSYVQGISCECVYATYEQTIYETGWSFSDGEASYSENVAYGTGTYVKKLLFVTLDTLYIDIYIKCNNGGQLVE